MKFVHCADLHLDTAFSGLTNEKSIAIRQAELRSTFLSIIDLAKEADALVISGDLFDQNSLEAETVHVLLKGFSSLGDIPVFIAAGNHDPLTEESYYRLASFSPNVHVFGTELEKVAVAGVDFYGISFAGSVQDAPILEHFKAETGAPSVLVMHGDLGGTSYNPISRAMIEKSGLSYLALGHVHSFMQETIGKTLCVYPGCPEGRGFDELGEKGVAVVTISETGAEARFVPLAKRQHEELSVDVTGALTHEEIIEKIKENCIKEQDLYKIILSGETELVPNASVIEEAFSDCFFVKVVDTTSRPLSLESLLSDSGLKGMFVRKLVEQGDTLDRKALEYGLLALDGEKVKLS